MAPLPSCVFTRPAALRWVLPLLALLLAGCARPPIAPPPDRASAWVAHRALLTDLRSWELRGRIAVKLERDAFSATLHWRQDGPRYNLRVIAPLGRGTFELTGAPDGVALRTADNRVIHAADAEALLRENLGWELPVTGLRWWVRGLPRPGVAGAVLDVNEAGWLTALTQQGWQVRYQEHRAQGVLLLPARMNLENGPVRVRLAVTEWRTGMP